MTARSTLTDLCALLVSTRMVSVGNYKLPWPMNMEYVLNAMVCICTELSTCHSGLHAGPTDTRVPFCAAVLCYCSQVYGELTDPLVCKPTKAPG